MIQPAPVKWQGRFFTRVFTRLGLLIALGMLVVGGFTWQIMQHWLREYVVEQLRNQAHLALLSVERNWTTYQPRQLQEQCRQVREQTGLRMTIIAPDGRVLADSNADPSEMENHAGRPEVVSALQGEVGLHERVSASVRQPFFYVAMPLLQAGELVAVVRVATPAEDIQRRERAIRQLIGTGLAVALPLALLLAWLLSRALAAPIQRVSTWAQQLATGDLVTRLEIRGDDEIKQMADSLDRMRSNLAARIREAQQQRQDLEITVSNLEEGVIAVNRDGIVLLANAAARRLLGLRYSPAGGPLAEQLTHRGLRRFWEDALGAGTSESRRELTIESDGGTRTLDVSILHVTQIETPIAWLVCLRDITAIARSVAMKTDFVANASHELRTPVASIRAAVETLRETGLDEPTRRRFLSIIDRNVDRLQNLTEDLMHLNKVESVAVELVESTFDPAEVFAALRTMFEDALRQKQAELTYVSDVDLIHTDQRWLELVLKNLLDNAVKFIGPGGRIHLRCAAVGEKVAFEVQDNGCGIPPEDMDRVFERFYQVDKSRAMNVGGTGLGLAIVKHAVSAMRGEVSISSTVGVGTVVRFMIPALAPATRPSTAGA